MAHLNLILIVLASSSFHVIVYHAVRFASVVSQQIHPLESLSADFTRRYVGVSILLKSNIIIFCLLVLVVPIPLEEETRPDWVLLGPIIDKGQSIDLTSGLILDL